MTTANPALTPEEAQVELRRRLRSYFVKVVSMLIASLVVAPLVLGAILKTMDVQNAKAIAAAVSGLSMLSTVAFAWYLVFTTWRCPACDANIYWLVSWNMSAFAAGAKKTCPKCNIELFQPRSGRFVLIFILIAVAIGALGAIGAATAGAQKRQKQQDTVTQPQPQPPG
ncbi:MAG: hypothetical protein QM817_35675 [Archangium sp.]